MTEEQKEIIAAETGQDLQDIYEPLSTFDVIEENDAYPDLNYCINHIKSEEIKKNLYTAFTDVPEYFYNIPASSTGKYHPAYATGEGGLLRHTIAAARIACDLVDLEMYGLTDDEKDYIICALLLHDTFKSGVTHSKYTLHNHPLLSAQHVRKVCSREFADNVCPLIESHMGQWNTCKWDKTVLPKPETKLQQIVHLCDYLASRKYLTFEFSK